MVNFFYIKNSTNFIYSILLAIYFSYFILSVMEEIEENVGEQLDDIIKDLCKRLKIVAADVGKLQQAKEQLLHLQRQNTFINLIGFDDDTLGAALNYQINHSFNSCKYNVGKEGSSSINSIESEYGGEELSEDPCQAPFEEDRWRSYFTGYEILSTPKGAESQSIENRKCINLSNSQCELKELKDYLRSGVRCFMLDLFSCSLRDNQTILVELRKAELNVSKEYGFPVISTIFAKLSPRYQYTGYLDALLTDGRSAILKRGSKLLLSVDRAFSHHCTANIIYVNARFLLADVKEFDFILIGEEIQLVVRSVHPDHLICCVAHEGTLTSFMPVLFPGRCRKFRMSYEELEDLTFVREVGINVVVSNIAGSAKYLNDLESCMAILSCEHLRMYARVVLNKIQGCDNGMSWVVQRYDGFLVELASPTIPEKTPDIMNLCPDAECFMQLAYASKKPILLDPWPISAHELLIDPAHYYYIFYFPDKFVINCEQSHQSFYFSFLQNAIFDQIPTLALSKMPYCDNSHTGADSMARAVVTAALEVNAAAIIVSGVTTRMVQKISHFRPHAPIIFVSHMRSAEDYVSLYYNVTMLSFRTVHIASHQRNTYRKIIYGVAYLSSRKIAKQGDNIILVYNYKAGTTFPENYLIYKFDMKHFPNHLALTMFPMENDASGQQTLTID